MPATDHVAEGAASAAARQRRGFTLLEMLLVIGIMVSLMGLTLLVVKMARDASHRAATAALVQRVWVATTTYEIDRHCLPPVEADQRLYTRAGSGPRRTLDLLADFGLSWTSEHLSEQFGSPRWLQDGWGRPIQYVADQISGGAMQLARPASAADWNPRDAVPFAYVWSFGIPSSNSDAWDQDPTNNLKAWIYAHPQ